MKAILPLILGLVVGCGGEERDMATDLRTALEIPHFRNPLDPRLVKSWRHLDLIFEEIEFQGRYGENIPALICYSAMGRTRPLPAVICMPGSSNRKEDLLRPLDLIPQWAEKGFFVISIDRPYAGDRPGDLGEAIQDKGLPKVWGEYVYDLLCVLDYLQTRSEVDAQRIGMLGLSMGGWEALLLAAVDERVKVVVSVAGHLLWEEIFKEGIWQLIFQGLDLRNQLVERKATGTEAWVAFRRSYPAMQQLDAPSAVLKIAPRPLLLMTGDKDPYIVPMATRKTHEAAREVYRSLGKEERLALWIAPDTGHSFPRAMQQRALDWFVRWLKEEKPSLSQSFSDTVR